VETNEDKQIPMLENDIVEVIFEKYQGELFAERKALLEAVRMGRKLEAGLNGRR
jgi:hypothetical protein